MRKMISIEGMSCGHCALHVQSALEDVRGVSSVKVDLVKKNAMVEGDALDSVVLRSAVIEVGYRVVSIIP